MRGARELRKRAAARARAAASPDGRQFACGDLRPAATRAECRRLGSIQKERLCWLVVPKFAVVLADLRSLGEFVAIFRYIFGAP